MAAARNKTQIAMLRDVQQCGEVWFASDGTSYGRRKLDAARALSAEGLVHIDHDDRTEVYRVHPNSDSVCTGNWS